MNSYVRALRIVGATVAIATLTLATALDVGRPLELAPLPPPTAAESLIAEHDCRVQGYGSELIPGHAIVDTGTGARYARSDVGFAILDGRRAGTLYAFCV